MGPSLLAPWWGGWISWIGPSLALLLCGSLWASGVLAHYPTGKNRPCCFSVTKNDLSSKVVGTFFYDTPGRRPCVRAVIFNTEKGPICVDHNEQWVKKCKFSFLNRNP
uniref:Chemokine interleukin-8-like domain-containing protein n=1 Tax=Cyprinodon variegatus TaxID=28743 RepID=A0A3Q2GJQ5_CYPVA